MKVLMLDTKQEEELDEIEAVCRIRAGVAVEPPMSKSMRDICQALSVLPELLGIPEAPMIKDERTADRVPETAALDRSGSTAMKPSPQPRPAPQGSPKQEKRGRKR